LGNTLATALAIEPATFATMPFFELRFFALAFDLVRVADLDFAFVFVAAFAITDSPTPSRLQIMLIFYQ
jgi:hypothetical protein